MSLLLLLLPLMLLLLLLMLLLLLLLSLFVFLMQKFAKGLIKSNKENDAPRKSVPTAAWIMRGKARISGCRRSMMSSMAAHC